MSGCGFFFRASNTRPVLHRGKKKKIKNKKKRLKHHKSVEADGWDRWRQITRAQEKG